MKVWLIILLCVAPSVVFGMLEVTKTDVVPATSFDVEKTQKRNNQEGEKIGSAVDNVHPRSESDDEEVIDQRVAKSRSLSPVRKNEDVKVLAIAHLSQRAQIACEKVEKKEQGPFLLSVFYGLSGCQKSHPVISSEVKNQGDLPIAIIKALRDSTDFIERSFIDARLDKIKNFKDFAELKAIFFDELKEYSFDDVMQKKAEAIEKEEAAEQRRVEHNNVMAIENIKTRQLEIEAASDEKITAADNTSAEERFSIVCRKLVLSIFMLCSTFLITAKYFPYVFTK
jgi:hypothetical protein